jgi:hypothetical protein
MQPMGYLRFSLVAWLVLTLAVPSWAAASADAWQVVPGQSIGPVRLGASARDLPAATGWGQPDKTHVAGSLTYLTYTGQGFTVGVRNEQIVLILTTNARHRTDKGVAVGQAASAAAASYGAPSSGSVERVHWYDGVGLVVVVGASIIVRLGVYDPKTFYRALLVDERPARNVFLTARQPKYGSPTRDKTGTAVRTAQITLTVKNASPEIKVLNPNFLSLIDRDGKNYKFDPSTFGQSDACRSAVSVRPGEMASCTVVFVIPAAASARLLVFNDGGSIDEFAF